MCDISTFSLVLSTILNDPLVRCVRKLNTDGRDLAREAIFIRLVSLGMNMVIPSEDVAVSVLDDTSNRTRANIIKQVWNFCVLNSVVEQNSGGWTTRQWVERILRINRTMTCDNITNDRQLQHPTEPEIESEQTERTDQKVDNVFLSDSEMEQLKAKFPSDYEDMINVLSEWKRRKGNISFTSSDFRMLSEGWVAKKFARSRNGFGKPASFCPEGEQISEARLKEIDELSLRYMP